LKTLNIILPAIESESEVLKKNLARLIERLERAGIPNYEVLVIFQMKSKFPTDLGGPYPPEVRIIPVSFYSVSRARNLGLSMVPLDTDHFVYFLDCDAVPSDGFLEMAKWVLDSDVPFARGRVFWREEESGLPPSGFPGISSRKHVQPMWRVAKHYLWIHLIRGDMLSGIRFKERIGPGESTTLKSGEDMLYYYEIVKRNHLTKFMDFPDCHVYHPERPADLSKELLYARGQGAMYRHLIIDLGLPRGARIGLAFLFVLFLGNALFRVATFRRNGFGILKERLRGILYSDLQGYFKTPSDEVMR
jgi:hypothetical protein